MGIDLNDNSILEDVEIKSIASVCNGLDGVDGEDGQDGLDGLDGRYGNAAVSSQFSIAAIYMPCAANPMSPTQAELRNSNLEVMLKLENGLLVSSISDNTAGKNTRFGLVNEGTWLSTGAQSCTFTVRNGYIYR